MNVNSIIEKFIKDYAETFCEWAWGPEFKSKNLRSKWSVDTWNERHGDKFRIYRNSEIFKDINKMIELWKKDCILKKLPSTAECIADGIDSPLGKMPDPEWVDISGLNH